MAAQIIKLAEYRKAKEAERARQAVDDYFAACCSMMAWWLNTAFLQWSCRSVELAFVDQISTRDRSKITASPVERGIDARQPCTRLPTNSTTRAPRIPH
jgi:hypothetical protein